MAYKDPNRKLTVKDYVRLFVVLALFGAFVIFVLKLAGTPKPVATYTQVWDVLVAHRYTPVDLTEEYIKDDPSLKNALLQNITANQDGFQIAFYVFADQNYSKNAYTSLNKTLSEIERRYSTSSVETGGYWANFIVHEIQTGGKDYYLMRIGETILYAHGDEQYSGEMYSVAKELGYYF